ncbi:zinc finger matrin-type protein 3 [Osmerus eperlanus]|uniref:zinc finger matrin-type protein 3 n=1 Tax=Osmerus eperlanus TaxID=29151 RepID=UPI002E0F121C
MMALHVKNRDAYYQSADYCRNFGTHPLNYGDSSHYFGRLAGPEAMLKPPLGLFGHHQQQPFQTMGPPPTLGPPPVVVDPDSLRFPLPRPLTATTLPPHPHLLQRATVPLLPLAPDPCSGPIPGPHPGPGPGLVPVPGPGPLLPQAAPASVQPQEDDPLLGEEESDSTLEDMCKPLYCKLCNVTLNSAQQAQAHYQGKNHSKKLRNFYAGSQQPPPIRIPESTEPVTQQPLPTSSTESVPSKQPVPLSFKGASRVILATENDYCKLCDASFSSPAVAQAHYQGKNHAKRLRLAEAQQACSTIDPSESTQRRQRKEGSEYRLVKNRRTLQVSAAMPGPYYNPRPRQRIPRDLAMCVTPSGQFYCSMCNCGAGEEPNFRLHLESKQHKSKVSEQRYRSEMETLGYT